MCLVFEELRYFVVILMGPARGGEEDNIMYTADTGENVENKVRAGKQKMNGAERQSTGLSEVMSWNKCEQISKQTRKRDLMGKMESYRGEAIARATRDGDLMGWRWRKTQS